MVLLPVQIGKKVKAKDGDTQKSKTINGKKYEFDTHGAMTAEWSLDIKGSKDLVRNDYSTSTHTAYLLSMLRSGDATTALRMVLV